MHILEALALPPESMVEQRIPKKMLAEQGSPTAADKRQIQDGIEELNWVAALKPTNIGVAAFRDDEREYLEIAVLSVIYRPKAKAARLNELVHRAVPYPVVLVSSMLMGEGETAQQPVQLSVAHKRFAQNEAGKYVVDELLVTPPILEPALSEEKTNTFLAALALAHQPQGNLYELYQGWVGGVMGFAVSAVTGEFSRPSTAQQLGQMRECLAEYNKLQDEISTLKKQAEKEKQMNRRVDLNLRIKGLESRLAQTQSTLAQQ